MPDPDVVVVGGGIAGLTCAAFLARQGIDVVLLERDDRLGGLARSIKVGDWLIPANLGRTEGFAEDDPKVRILRHLEVLERLGAVPAATTCEVRGDNGWRVVVPAGWDAAREALLEAFAEERPKVDGTLARLQKLAAEVERLSDDSRSAALRFLAFPFFYPTLFRQRRRTAAELLRSSVRNPRARVALGALAPLIGTSPATVGATAYALAATAMLRRPVTIPGGGRTLAQALAESARANGADVRTKTPVTSILVDGRSVRGVRTAEHEIRSRVVVLNAPALVAFGTLVPRAAIHAGYLLRIGSLSASASACVLLAALRIPRQELDARSDLLFVHAGDDPEAHERALGEDSVAGRTIAAALHPSAEPAEDGGPVTLLTALVPDRVARWAREDEGRREALAEEVRRSLLARLGFLHADLERRIAASRLLTPLELADWSGDPEAALFGWEPSPGQTGVQRLESRTPVDGLFLAGGWTSPGGGYASTLLSGFLAGLQAAMQLRKRVRM